MQYNFTVPSLTVNNPRSLENDTDYASLGIVALAPGGAPVATYGPITKSLGNVGKGDFVPLRMGLTEIDVPDGGSIGVVFTVLNKGSWKGKGPIETALNTVCAGVVGAVAGGQLVTATTTTAATATTAEVTTGIAIPLWEAAVVAAVAVGVMEGIGALLADCDGWVVDGTTTIGRVEMDQNAMQFAWNFSVNYPGSDSQQGCGANSNYTVNYQIAASSIEVTVPNLKGLTPTAAMKALNRVDLNGAQRRQIMGDVETPQVGAQDPPAGTLAPHWTIVNFDVEVPHTGTNVHTK